MKGQEEKLGIVIFMGDEQWTNFKSISFIFFVLSPGKVYGIGRRRRKKSSATKEAVASVGCIRVEAARCGHEWRDCEMRLFYFSESAHAKELFRRFIF